MLIGSMGTVFFGDGLILDLWNQYVIQDSLLNMVVCFIISIISGIIGVWLIRSAKQIGYLKKLLWVLLVCIILLSIVLAIAGRDSTKYVQATGALVMGNDTNLEQKVAAFTADRLDYASCKATVFGHDDAYIYANVSCVKNPESFTNNGRFRYDFRIQQVKDLELTGDDDQNPSLLQLGF